MAVLHCGNELLGFTKALMGTINFVIVQRGTLWAGGMPKIF
jgi:hypothetical protein